MNSRYIHLGFPVTTPPSVYRLTYYGGGADVGAYSDCNGYIAKLDLNGNMIWCTLFGGPNYTRCYDIRVDSNGNIYATGRTGRSLDVTVDAIQPTFAGANNGSYGDQNAFLAKFDQYGSLIWMTYLGTSHLCRNLNLSPDETYLIMPLSYVGSGNHIGNSPACAAYGPSALSGAYLDTPTAHINAGCMKITSDGIPTYATYLGGNDDSNTECQVIADSSGNVYLLARTLATDLPVTAGCLSPSVGYNMYVCKFDSTLSNMLWGTYLGGSGDEGTNTDILALDSNGNLIVGGWTSSTNWPGTSGGYMATYPAGAINTAVITKLNGANGNLIQATYFGGTDSDSCDGISLDSSDNIWFANATTSTDMPCTANAYQASHGGGSMDGAVVCLSNDLKTLVYSSYLGGTNNDNIRAVGVSLDGSRLLAAGSVDGNDYPILNAYQNTYQGYPGGDPGYGSYSGDAVISLFNQANNPASLIFSTFLGGTHWDMARAARIVGNYCYVSGGTHSHDFPTQDD